MSDFTKQFIDYDFKTKKQEFGADKRTQIKEICKHLKDKIMSFDIEYMDEHKTFLESGTEAEKEYIRNVVKDIQKAQKKNLKKLEQAEEFLLSLFD